MSEKQRFIWDPLLDWRIKNGYDTDRNPIDNKDRLVRTLIRLIVPLTVGYFTNGDVMDKTIWALRWMIFGEVAMWFVSGQMDLRKFYKQDFLDINMKK